MQVVRNDHPSDYYSVDIVLSAAEAEVNAKSFYAKEFFDLWKTIFSSVRDIETDTRDRIGELEPVIEKFRRDNPEKVEKYKTHDFGITVWLLREKDRETENALRGILPKGWVIPEVTQTVFLPDAPVRTASVPVLRARREMLDS